VISQISIKCRGFLTVENNRRKRDENGAKDRSVENAINRSFKGTHFSTTMSMSDNDLLAQAQ
jgi:hypothetical protein